MASFFGILAVVHLAVAGETDFPNGGSLRDAQWVWTPNANGLKQGAPPGEYFFVREVEVPAGAGIKKAVAWVSVDDEFELFVNGKRSLKGQSWQNCYSGDVTAFLKPGKNLLAVKGVSKGGPGAMLFAIEILLEGGKQIVLESDGDWQSASEVKEGWNMPERSSETEWGNVDTLGFNGMKPWGTRTPDNKPAEQ